MWGVTVVVQLDVRAWCGVVQSSGIDAVKSKSQPFFDTNGYNVSNMVR